MQILAYFFNMLPWQFTDNNGIRCGHFSQFLAKIVEVANNFFYKAQVSIKTRFGIRRCVADVSIFIFQILSKYG